MDGDTFPSIVDEIVSNLEESGQLEKDAVDAVRMVLLKRHRHTGDTSFWGKKKSSSSGEFVCVCKDDICVCKCMSVHLCVCVYVCTCV